METRANHVVIGAFVLVFIAGLFGFVIWLAKIEIDRKFTTYHIYFDSAVSGLSNGGDVRYNGIPVGTVTDIVIDPQDPSRVLVKIETGSETPVRVDTIATLEYQGITGVSFVQLKGGGPKSKMLRPAKKGEVAVIPSEPSALQELFAGAPEVIDRVIILVERLSQLVNERNQKHVASILANADDLSTRLAKRGPEFEEIVVNLAKASADLRDAVAGVNTLVVRLNAVADSADATMSVARGTLASVDDVLAHDVKRLADQIGGAAQSLDRLTRDFEKLMDDNRESIDAFAGDGLVEFTKFLEEARSLVAVSSRLIEDLQSDPTQFLFGRQQGVEVE